jgi:hypothetical protein
MCGLLNSYPSGNHQRLLVFKESIGLALQESIQSKRVGETIKALELLK